MKALWPSNPIIKDSIPSDAKFLPFKGVNQVFHDSNKELIFCNMVYFDKRNETHNIGHIL